MRLLLALVLLAAPGPAVTPPAAPAAAELADAEAKALLHLRQSFERVGRSSPVSDPALTQAARTLAREALLGTAQAAGGTRIGLAVSEAGGWDPNPRLVLIRSWRTETTLQSFLQRTEFTAEPASHAGVALVADDDHTVLALLLAERKAVVQPFPRKVAAAPSRQRLCFELRAPLGRPSVFVTRPSGAVDRLTDISGRNGSYCAPVSFQGNGRHALEVLGEGAEGPEVAAMFSVEVGPVAAVAARCARGARSRARPRRRGYGSWPGSTRCGARPGRPPSRSTPVSMRSPSAYADRMASQRFFAHVSPDGDALPDRLEQGGYSYVTSGENLGMASGPLAAHAAIEESPGHRKNLLDPAFERVGFGLARQARDGGSEVILVELFATPAKGSGGPGGGGVRAPHGRARGDEAPGAAAERGARGHRRPPGPGGAGPRRPAGAGHRRPGLRRRSPRRGPPRRTSTSPATSSALPPSRGLKEARYSMVGIGAVRGDSPTYGKGRYWVVVIYAGL